ncbi:tetratricopeptide repeat protein [Lewinella sp. JB7]|uniref:tetratricopeptide repeat protein n=1 Tax=Lewinella sp. JB7 TaxID=2962887 RepID=UPI0020C9F96E|nr:tetratricopeptide repeat protein [Lewinella sp. JB7]MCP9234841.1 tetratricopeptide repeat protein [Lewinella sp. JB7]
MTPPDRLTPELLAQIEAYYDGELPTEAADRLRERLGQDETLARQVAEWEAVYRYGLRDQASQEDEDLRNTFRSFEAEMATAAPPAVVRKLPVRRWLAVAAAVLLLLAAGWWILPRPDPAARLAEENFTWLIRDDARLGPQRDEDPTGVIAYDNSRYAEAYPKIIAAVANGTLDSLNLLYAGVAAFGAGEPERARELLRELLDSGNYGSFDEAAVRYYLALAELKLGNVAAAREQLTVAAPADPDFVLRRESLLRRVKELE